MNHQQPLTKVIVNVRISINRHGWPLPVDPGETVKPREKSFAQSAGSAPVFIEPSTAAMQIYSVLPQLHF